MGSYVLVSGRGREDKEGRWKKPYSFHELKIFIQCLFIIYKDTVVRAGNVTHPCPPRAYNLEV